MAVFPDRAFPTGCTTAFLDVTKKKKIQVSYMEVTNLRAANRCAMMAMKVGGTDAKEP